MRLSSSTGGLQEIRVMCVWQFVWATLCEITCLARRQTNYYSLGTILDVVFSVTLISPSLSHTNTFSIPSLTIIRCAALLYVALLPKSPMPLLWSSEGLVGLVGLAGLLLCPFSPPESLLASSSMLRRDRLPGPPMENDGGRSSSEDVSVVRARISDLTLFQQ